MACKKGRRRRLLIQTTMMLPAQKLRHEMEEYKANVGKNVYKMFISIRSFDQSIKTEK
jgi:hypothetical protein